MNAVRAMRMAWVALFVAPMAGCDSSNPSGPQPPDDVSRAEASSSPDVADGSPAPDLPSPPDVADASPGLDAPSPRDVLDVSPALDTPSPSDVADSSPAADAPSASRMVAPLSTATVTSRRPALRWALGSGASGARVQLCRDRACTMVIATLDVTGTSATPTEDLPTGVVFWRVYWRSGTTLGATPGPTWEMVVGRRSAPVNTSFGTAFDVNGDGYADLAVGGSYTESGEQIVHVYHGGAGGIGTSPASSLTGPAGPNGSFGVVASAGDVNGDGYADLVVGAPCAPAPSARSCGPGRVYMYLGSPRGIQATPTATLEAPDSGEGFFGHSVASAGDVNGDGYADLVVGAFCAPATSGCGLGRAYVYLGSAGGVGTSPAITYTGDPRFHDGSGGDFGNSVASAGDVNGDGYSDLVVGTRESRSHPGHAYVYLGSASGPGAAPAIVLAALDRPGTLFGEAVASAGDVNGDGYADLIVGASGDGGRAYVYLGGAGGIGATAATTLAGPAGGYDGSFGIEIAGGGDINGDGYADLVVGAPFGPYDPGTNVAGPGRAFVFLGGATGISDRPAATLSGPDGRYGRFGGEIASAGDFDRDGYADVAIGADCAPAPDVISCGSGRVYVYPGSMSGIGSSPSVTLAGPDRVRFGSYVASFDPRFMRRAALSPTLWCARTPPRASAAPARRSRGV